MHKIIQLFVAVLFFGSLPEKKVLETIFGRYYYKLGKRNNLNLYWKTTQKSLQMKYFSHLCFF